MLSQMLQNGMSAAERRDLIAHNRHTLTMPELECDESAEVPLVPLDVPGFERTGFDLHEYLEAREDVRFLEDKFDSKKRRLEDSKVELAHVDEQLVRLKLEMDTAYAKKDKIERSIVADKLAMEDCYDEVQAKRDVLKERTYTLASGLMIDLEAASDAKKRARDAFAERGD